FFVTMQRGVHPQQAVLGLLFDEIVPSSPAISATIPSHAERQFSLAGRQRLTAQPYAEVFAELRSHLEPHSLSLPQFVFAHIVDPAVPIWQGVRDNANVVCASGLIPL